MLPLSTVQQSLDQARNASRALRALVHAPTASSAQEVRACMESGAQPQWMSKQGTQGGENALMTALSRGHVDAVEVLLEYAGKQPVPRGQSVFAVALGPHKDTVHPEDYRRSVQLLLQHGYSFAQQECVANPGLAEAFARSCTHAGVLLEMGAAQVLHEQEVVERVLCNAMRSDGGMEVLLQYATPQTHPLLGTWWWWAARDRAGRIKDEEVIVAKGLQLAPPSNHQLLTLLGECPSLLGRMLQHGACLPASAGYPLWDANAPHEPFWRHHPEDVPGVLAVGASRELNLSTPESLAGQNWLSFLVKEHSWVDAQSYRREGRSGVVAAVLERAFASGLDVASRDCEGKTSGWHILCALDEHDNASHKHAQEGVSSPQNTQGWLDLVDRFSLCTPFVLDQGNEVSVLEAEGGRMSRLLARHGMLEKVQVAIDQGMLDRSTQASVRPHPVRRM